MALILQKTNIEFLISTMNRDSLDFLLPMFPQLHFSNFNILIVNQSQNNQKIISKYPNIRVINSSEKGLSKSRNLALKNAQKEILVIADDDVVYKEDFLSTIVLAYNKNPTAIAINFCAENFDGKLMKNYPLYSKNKFSVFDVFKVSSIEMTLNKTLLNKTEVYFDEKFGLGSCFEMGEEAIFLFDLKRKQQQLVFEPQVIVRHDSLTSSDKKNIYERYFIHGAVFFRIFKNYAFFWFIIQLFFDLKHHKLKINQLKTTIKSYLQGQKQFKVISASNEH